MAEKASVFRSFAKIKDRKFRLKTYKSCFVASQVVDALVENGVVETREAAVEYGQDLEDQLRLFQHVCGPGIHSFKDEYLFFRFRDLGFKDGADPLGVSLNSANEMSVSTMGVDYGGQDADGAFVEMLGGSGGQGFGLAVLDENSELEIMIQGASWV